LEFELAAETMLC